MALLPMSANCCATFLVCASARRPARPLLAEAKAPHSYCLSFGWISSGQLCVNFNQGRREAQFPRLNDSFESFYNLEVKLGAANLADDLKSLFNFHGGLIRTIGGYGIERVGYRDDPGHHRDFVALQAIRIALAVNMFVMQLNPRQNILQLSNRAHDVGALTGMLLHDLEFS